MERSLFSFLALLTGILAFSTWVKPGAIEDVAQMLGAKTARAEGDLPDPKRDPFQQLPPPRMPNLPVSPTRPASWPGEAPDYISKYRLPTNGTQLAANQPQPNDSIFGPPPGPAFNPNPGPNAGTNPALPPSGNVNVPPAQNGPVWAQPSAPAAPTTNTPPPGWTPPTGPAMNPGFPVNPAATQPSNPGEVITAGQWLATVGSEVIMAADVLPTVNEVIASQGEKIPENQLDGIRKMLLQKYAISQIETKLLYADAKRTIPAANLPGIEKNVAAEFDRSRLPDMIKKSGVTGYAELDAKLQKVGSSVEKQKKAFTEQMLAYSWLSQQTSKEEEVRRDDLYAYYVAHRAEYEILSQARWEQITARYDRFPSKGEAFRAVAEWGNEVMKGKQFFDVAKAHSHGITASEGGQFNWTSQGSLRSEALDQAIFSLPAGHLSQILEDEDGFHIIRVLERRPAGKKPFEEVQMEIKKKLKQEKAEDRKKTYLAKLREKTPVKTMWDNQPGGESVPEAASARGNAFEPFGGGAQR